MTSTAATVVQRGQTHSFIRYPAKFPTDPVHDYLIRFSQPGDTVLDPFCGSGTVLVEAIRNGRECVGIELNPVAALASRVKARLYDEEQMEEIRRVIKRLRKYEAEALSWVQRNLSTSVLPTYKNVNHWFESVMLNELSVLRSKVVNGFNGDAHVKELLWLSFLKTIIPASKQDSETRYTAVKKKEHRTGYAITVMRKTLEGYCQAIELELRQADAAVAEARVIVGDSLLHLKGLETSSVNLVITSPPYINTYDYYLYHKHRIFWYGGNPIEIRRKEVGCHHRIDTMSHQGAVQEYEEYLENIFVELRRILKPQGHLAILIGDGIVKDRMVPADELVSRIALKAGLHIIEINSVHQTEVSRGFIKDKRIIRKKHHAIVLGVDNAKTC